MSALEDVYFREVPLYSLRFLMQRKSISVNLMENKYFVVLLKKDFLEFASEQKEHLKKEDNK